MKKNVIIIGILIFILIGTLCFLVFGNINRKAKNENNQTTTNKTTTESNNNTNFNKGFAIQFNNFTCLVDNHNNYKYLTYVDESSISFDLNYLLSNLDNTQYKVDDAVIEVENLKNLSEYTLKNDETWSNITPQKKYLNDRLYVYYLPKQKSAQVGVFRYQYIFLDSLTKSFIRLYDYVRDEDDCKIAKWTDQNVENFIKKYIKLFNDGELKNVARLDFNKIKSKNNKIYIDDTTYLFLDSKRPSVWEPNSTYANYKSTSITKTGDEIKYRKTETNYSTGYKFINPESGEEIWMLSSKKDIDLTEEQINSFVNEYYTYESIN